jgi:arylsulfatase A-like enzyme
MRILVITAAGLRPDYLGCYGSDWVDTPHFDQLAAQAIVFDNHHAVRPDLEGAAIAWLTGSYRLCNERPSESAGVGNLLQQLHEERFESTLIGDAGRPPSKTFTEGWNNLRLASSLDDLLGHVEIVLKQSARKKKVLVWVDVPMLLPPWRLPQEFLEAYFSSEPGDEERLVPLLNPPSGVFASLEERVIERIQHTFAAAITHADAVLGQIFEDLAGVDPKDQWLILVTAPHGQSLGEHGLIDPGKPWLHEERIHVPFLLRLPEGKEAGRRVPALTQAIDLPATVLDAAGVKPVNMDGQSLLPLTHGTRETLRAYSFSTWRLGKDQESALRTPEWKLILSSADNPPSRQRQLYGKPEDRWEVNNVLQHHLELADELEKELSVFSGEPLASSGALPRSPEARR